MFGSVLILGRIATANVAADPAMAKVNPAVSHLEAFLTPSSVGFLIGDLVQVSALAGHDLTNYSLIGKRTVKVV